MYKSAEALSQSLLKSVLTREGVPAVPGLANDVIHSPAPPSSPRHVPAQAERASAEWQRFWRWTLRLPGPNRSWTDGTPPRWSWCLHAEDPRSADEPADLEPTRSKLSRVMGDRGSSLPVRDDDLVNALAASLPVVRGVMRRSGCREKTPQQLQRPETSDTTVTDRGHRALERADVLRSAFARVDQDPAGASADEVGVGAMERVRAWVTAQCDGHPVGEHREFRQRLRSHSITALSAMSAT